MVDENEVLERLDRYAKGIAHRILLKFNLASDIHRGEDIAQVLLIAGATVWRKTRDVALAKNRMSSRGNNAARNLFRELERQPQPLPRRTDSCDDGREENFPDVTGGQDGEWISDCAVSRSSPLEDMIVREYLDSLPERQRRIVEHRMAGLEFKEIAEALGISLSTVEREMAALRKGFRHEQDN